MVKGKAMGIFQRFRHSEYARHSTLLMAGTIISMLLQTLSFAWLGRWYSDEYMGLYQYFATAYSILLIPATGRYELAVMLPKADSDGLLLALLSGGCSILFAFLAGLFLLIVQVAGVSLGWVSFLPLGIAVLGVYYSCNYWLNRNRRYRALAVCRVIQGILFVFFNVAFAFFLPNRRYGLILGFIAAQSGAAALLFFVTLRDILRLRRSLSRRRLLELALEYRNFPRLSAPSGIVNTLAVQLPVLLLSALAGDAAVGQYSMMNKVLGAPISVISEAIRDVFRQKASREYAEKGECEATFRSTFKTLALAAVPPFLLLMLLAFPVFRALFGNAWDMAASFILMMSPFYYVRFVVSPLTYLTYIAGKQRFDMLWQMGFCAASLAAFLLGRAVSEGPYWMMLFYGIAQAVCYGVSYRYTRKLSRGGGKP